MSELPEGWKKSEHTPHIDGPNATLWVSDGGLVGVNEAAIIVYSKEFDEVVSVPLRAVQAACDASKSPQNIVVRWNTHEVGKDLVSINEVVRILERWESGTVTSTYKTATEVVHAMRDEMRTQPADPALPDGWKYQDDESAADGEDSDGLLRVSIYTNSKNEWRLYADGPKGDVPLAAVLAVLRRANLIPNKQYSLDE